MSHRTGLSTPLVDGRRLRYVVGWTIAEEESSAVASRLIHETLSKQRIWRHQLAIHSDRGHPMTAKSLGQLLGELDITRSLSRPRVSNDNPFSESQFKTLKYHAGYPERFASLPDALRWARPFFHWYNTEHRHCGIAWLTPETVHYGRAQEVLDRRQQALAQAFQQHPGRFVRGMPRVPRLAEKVGINLPPPQAVTATMTP